jgi:uncharacterized membrane protein
MSTWGWVLIIVAVALVWGGVNLAWRAFSRPPRVRSEAMKALDEIYFAGDMSREEYARKKAELERKERQQAMGRKPSP